MAHIYTMMAKPIRALELHYPMIQFLMISISCVADSLKPRYRPYRVLSVLRSP